MRTDALWMARSASPNEGFMDKYYAYTTTVDFLGFGEHKLELPVALIILPTVGLLAWAAYDRRRHGAAGLCPRLRPRVALLADALIARAREQVEQQQRSATNSLRSA
jgi:hypothetical protein